MDTEKICENCKKSLDLSEFSNKNGKLTRWCKNCLAIKNKKLTCIHDKRKTRCPVCSNNKCDHGIPKESCHICNTRMCKHCSCKDRCKICLSKKYITEKFNEICIKNGIKYDTVEELMLA